MGASSCGVLHVVYLLTADTIVHVFWVNCSPTSGHVEYRWRCLLCPQPDCGPDYDSTISTSVSFFLVDEDISSPSGGICLAIFGTRGVICKNAVWLLLRGCVMEPCHTVASRGRRHSTCVCRTTFGRKPEGFPDELWTEVR